MKSDVLDPFRKEITECDDLIKVTYDLSGYTGYCTYKEYNTMGVNKPITQRFHILVDFNMMEVIDIINLISPLKVGDYDKLNELIRNDSLDFLNLHR